MTFYMVALQLVQFSLAVMADALPLVSTPLHGADWLSHIKVWGFFSIGTLTLLGIESRHPSVGFGHRTLLTQLSKILVLHVLAASRRGSKPDCPPASAPAQH